MVNGEKAKLDKIIELAGQINDVSYSVEHYRRQVEEGKKKYAEYVVKMDDLKAQLTELLKCE